MTLRKRVDTKRKKVWIYGSSTILGLLMFLFGLGSIYGIDVTTSGDINCTDVCVSYFNLSLKDYSVCFGSTFNGIYFEPHVYDWELYVKNSQESGRQYCTYGRSYLEWVHVKGDLYYCPSSTKQTDVELRYQRCDKLSSTNKMCYRKSGDVWLPAKELSGICFDKNKIYEFQLIGYKQPEATIKWGIDLQGIDLDPYWVGSAQGRNQFILHYET